MERVRDNLDNHSADLYDTLDDYLINCKKTYCGKKNGKSYQINNTPYIIRKEKDGSIIVAGNPDVDTRYNIKVGKDRGIRVIGKLANWTPIEISKCVNENLIRVLCNNKELLSVPCCVGETQSAEFVMPNGEKQSIEKYSDLIDLLNNISDKKQSNGICDLFPYFALKDMLVTVFGEKQLEEGKVDERKKDSIYEFFGDVIRDFKFIGDEKISMFYYKDGLTKFSKRFKFNKKDKGTLEIMTNTDPHNYGISSEGCDIKKITINYSDSSSFKSMICCTKDKKGYATSIIMPNGETKRVKTIGELMKLTEVSLPKNYKPGSDKELDPYYALNKFLGDIKEYYGLKGTRFEDPKTTGLKGKITKLNNEIDERQKKADQLKQTLDEQGNSQPNSASVLVVPIDPTDPRMD